MEDITVDVRIFPRDELELMLHNKSIGNAAIISFYDPPSNRTPRDYHPIDFSLYNNPVIKIGVHDIDIEILKDYGLSFDTYFPEAPALAKFIYKAVLSNREIICQCEYGQSRSPACAAAILEHFCKNGIRIFANYKYYPNQLIFNKTLDALRKYKLANEHKINETK